MTEVNEGDRVRVSYEGIVDDVDGNYLDFGDVGVFDNGTFEVEVLEKAKPKDDPASDPVGTVRQGSNGNIYVKTFHREYPWQNLSRASAYSDYGQSGNRDNAMKGSSIIGVVPGTTAAKAQEALIPLRDWQAAVEAQPQFKVGQCIKGDHNGNARLGVIVAVDAYCELCAEAGLSGKFYRVDDYFLISYESAQLAMPKVVQFGDAEPDRCKKFSTNPDEYGNSTVISYGGNNGWNISSMWPNYTTPWKQLVKGWFPLTEIQD